MARRYDKPQIAFERPPELRTTSLADLLSKKFDAPAWVIPNLLPVGLTILAAPPKTGKSLLALGLVLRVAYRTTGRDRSGLYLSLDDPSERRMQTRVLDILDGRPLERGAHFTTSAMTLDSGLCVQLRAWLREHTDVHIIVLDALATVKARRSGDDVFKSDYTGLKGLQELALDCGVAVLLVHHTRKMPGGEDWVNRISGTLGVAAMADALWLLERPRGSNQERLFVTSRDAPDTTLEVPLDDLLEGEWLPSGADPVKETFLIDQVLAAIKDTGPEGISAKAIAVALNMAPEQVKQQVRRLHQNGRIIRLRYGQYAARLCTLAESALDPGVEGPRDNEDYVAARLYTLAERPSAQETTGLAPLCKKVCHTLSAEMASNPDGNGADTQQYNSVQASDEACQNACANSDGKGPDAQPLQNSVQAGGNIRQHNGRLPIAAKDLSALLDESDEIAGNGVEHGR